MKPTLTRRKFIQHTSLATASIPFVRLSKNTNQSGEIPLRWLENTPQILGTTWGIPWPKGKLKKLDHWSLLSETGNASIQTWPLAYWPDGSFKWTAHALAPNTHLGQKLSLRKGQKPVTNIQISETDSTISIRNQTLEITIAKSGKVLIPSIKRNGKALVQNGRLVLHIQNQPELEIGETLKLDEFVGTIKQVKIEQTGPIRSVVKIEGTHVHPTSKLELLPFVIRLYIYAQSEHIKLMHTFIYDADEYKHFINGMGLEFEVDFLKEELHNRHIRFVGENQGVFAEAVRGLTGLRRDPGQAVREAQIQGKRTADVETFPANVGKRMHYIAAFGDYTLFQPTSESFEISKRTAKGHTWINATVGKRALGTAYLGTPSGGLTLGLRNFWQSYPAQIDIRDAHQSKGKITLWMWAPKASAMDLRFYHDGMGQDTYEKQLDALEINYEDYEPEFGTPMGVARTSEIYLGVLNATPSNQQLVQIAEAYQNPSQIIAEPDYLKASGAFGGAFALPDPNANSARKKIEDQLNFYFEFYKKQIEEHKWYGFWNYGDFMHSYDADRHMWRYDVGGYAWDNSELSTDIWLWTYFLSTGRADAFRVAEAMTRHTGEVDVHHIGRFSPLGSRHNVLHWGCSAKQLRISTAANRRYFYYLTADERVGDLMQEQIDAAKTLQAVVPIRKVNADVPKNTEGSDIASLGFGTDWGALAAAWLTEWERTQSTEMKTRLINSMESIAAQPHGFFTGLSFMNLKTGKFEIDKSNKISVSHLSAVFGLPEICFELIENFNIPSFEKAWLDYCRLYNASPEEQKQALGETLKKLNLQQGHARLTAYAAYKTQNKELAKRAWQEFYKGEGGFKQTSTQVKVFKGPEVLQPVSEGEDISTNAVAQWGLAALQCLAFVPNNLP